MLKLYYYILKTLNWINFNYPNLECYASVIVPVIFGNI